MAAARQLSLPSSGLGKHAQRADNVMFRVFSWHRHTAEPAFLRRFRGLLPDFLGDAARKAIAYRLGREQAHGSDRSFDRFMSEDHWTIGGGSRHRK